MRITREDRLAFHRLPREAREQIGACACERSYATWEFWAAIAAVLVAVWAWDRWLFGSGAPWILQVALFAAWFGAVVWWKNRRLALRAFVRTRRAAARPVSAGGEEGPCTPLRTPRPQDPPTRTASGADES